MRTAPRAVCAWGGLQAHRSAALSVVPPFIVSRPPRLEIRAGPPIVALGVKGGFPALRRQAGRRLSTGPCLCRQRQLRAVRFFGDGIVLSEEDAGAARIYDPRDSPPDGNDTSRGGDVKRRRSPWVSLLCISLGLLGACTSVKPSTDDATQPMAPTAAQDCASSTTDQAICMPASSLNLNALPLGSGKESAAPEQGYIWTCQAPAG